MPASVLVAVLVVAGVLTLLPSLVRRFDRAERADVELRDSSMRVLRRRPHRRTVPGRRPVAPPTVVLARIEEESLALGRSGASAGDSDVRAALISGALERHAAQRAEARTARAAEATASRWRARRPGSVAKPVRRRPRRPQADPASVRRWWLYRRRRVLVLLTLLVAGQSLGVAFVGPGFWTGFALSVMMLSGYLLHLRGIAASERRRRERIVLRRRRARTLAREAALAAGVAAEVESMVAEWLAMPRQARREPPPEEVVAVLAAGGQEVVQAADGTWYPREIPLPLYVMAQRAQRAASAAPPAGPAASPAAPASPAVPPAAAPVVPPVAPQRPAAYRPPVADEGDDDLPRAVNL
jgi:hypothetical protein